MGYYLPMVYINGIRLTGIKLEQEYDVSGFVRSVHIHAPDFEIQEKVADE